jgi:hypothetical protein
MRRQLLTIGINTYRLVSVGVALLSIYTFVYNCVRVDYNPPLHTFWALMHAGLGVAIFGAGVWWDRRWIRYCQLVMLTIVAFTTLNFNDNPWLGLAFLGVSVVVAYAYDFYDTHTVWKVLLTVVVTYLGTLIVYRDPVKSLLTWLGFGVASGVVSYILWDKVRRLIALTQEAKVLLDEASVKLRKVDKSEPHTPK